MLEELLDTVSKEKVYDLYFPIDEGSEVFGQYAHLCYQELKKSGYRVNLKAFYIEAQGKLDFCIGDSAKYRFAKLLSLTPEHTRAAILLNSAEENVAIILKTIEETYRAELQVDVKRMDLDFEHQEWENLQFGWRKYRIGEINLL